MGRPQESLLKNWHKATCHSLHLKHTDLEKLLNTNSVKAENRVDFNSTHRDFFFKLVNKKMDGSVLKPNKFNFKNKLMLDD